MREGENGNGQLTLGVVYLLASSLCAIRESDGEFLGFGIQPGQGIGLSQTEICGLLTSVVYQCNIAGAC
jgi:hypothetical protein